MNHTFTIENTQGDDDHHNKALLIVKLVTLFTLLVGSIIFCSAPIILSQWRWLHKRFKSMSTILKVMKLFEGFAGGILFAGGMLHLIPEASEKLSGAISDILEKKKRETDVWFVEFPWAPMTACCALMTIYFLENVVLKTVVYARIQQEKKMHEETSRSLINEKQTDYSSISNKDEKLAQHRHFQARKLSMSLFVNSLVIWLSLSVHSVFEGLGLGSETDEKSMWSLFAAIMAHKFVAAFALGVIIEKGFRGMDAERFLRKLILTILFVLSFALATPIGIAVGIGITEGGKSGENPRWEIAESLLLSLAAGAFLHVSLFEVLGHDESHSHSHMPEEDVVETLAEHEEHEEPHPAWLIIKFALFLVGFAIMALLARWT